jgi:septal ring factor EnvC (AmiA/AmiB activator)
MINLSEFQNNSPETLLYIDNKITKLESCIEKNRTYRESLELYLKKVEGQMKSLDAIIQRKKEKKKMMQILKFMEASPHIDFYRYDKDL